MALPLLAQALLSKGLNLLGNAVLEKGKDYIEDKLGVTIEDPQTTEDLYKLQELEQNHKEFLIEASIRQNQQRIDEQKDLLLSDESAREMQVAALQQEDIFAKRFVYYFASAWSLFSMAYIFGITFIGIPESSVRFSDTILGFLLGTLISQLISYFYGSSVRSARKDETIQNLTTTKTK